MINKGHNGRRLTHMEYYAMQVAAFYRFCLLNAHFANISTCYCFFFLSLGRHACNIPELSHSYATQQASKRSHESFNLAGSQLIASPMQHFRRKTYRNPKKAKKDSVATAAIFQLNVAFFSEVINRKEFKFQTNLAILRHFNFTNNYF